MSEIKNVQVTVKDKFTSKCFEEVLKEQEVVVAGITYRVTGTLYWEFTRLDAMNQELFIGNADFEEVFTGNGQLSEGAKEDISEELIFELEATVGERVDLSFLNK